MEGFLEGVVAVAAGLVEEGREQGVDDEGVGAVGADEAGRAAVQAAAYCNRLAMASRSWASSRRNPHLPIAICGSTSGKMFLAYTVFL